MRLVCHTDEVYSILLLLVQKILQEYRVAINNLNLYQNFQKKKKFKKIKRLMHVVANCLLNTSLQQH